MHETVKAAGPSNMRDPGRGQHLLLTVLGTNPQDALYALESGSNEADADSGSAPTPTQCRAPLAPLALLRLLPEERRPDHVLALCTGKAKEISYPILQAHLSPGCTAQAVDIPDGEAPRDADIHLAAMAASVAEHADSVQLTVDVTHGLRHFAFLTYVGVLYLAALRKVRIRGAYYGLLRQDAASPFLDLSPLLELPRWVHALRVLEETGSTMPMAEAIRRGRARPEEGSQTVRRLSNELSRFSKAYLSGLPLELGSQARLLLDQHLPQLRKRLKRVHRLPLADQIVEDLRCKMRRYALEGDPAEHKLRSKQKVILERVELERQARVVDDLFRHVNIAAALGLMSEWTVSWVVWRFGCTTGWLKVHESRKEAKNVLNAMAAAAEDSELRAYLREGQHRLGQFWNDLRDLRNGYAHHGLRPQTLVASKKEQKQLVAVCKYWKTTLRMCPSLPVSFEGRRDARLLVSPVGMSPGVLFSALDVCRSSHGFGEPTECLAICSRASEGRIQEDSLPFCQGQRGVFRLAEGMRYGRWLRPMTRRGRTGKWSEAGSLRGPAPAPPEFFQAGGNLSTGRVQERVRGRCPAPAGYSVDEFPAGYS